MASIASNAITLGRFLQVSPGVLISLMGRPENQLSEREKLLKRKVEQFLSVKGQSFNVSGSVIHMPPPPAQEPTMDSTALSRAVANANFELVNSIVDIRPEKKGVYTGSYATPQLPVNNWAMLSVMQAGSLYKKYGEQIRADLTECTFYIVSGGTEQALMKRFTSGFTSDIPVEPLDWWSDDVVFFETMYSVLPWNDKGTSDLSEAGLANNTYVINVASSYGLPYPDSQKRSMIVTTEGEVSGIELMVKEAQKLMDILVQGEDKLSEYISSPEGRPYFAALLKNKVELIKRVDFNEKTRPYFNFSAPLTWLFGQLFAAYSDGIPTFPYEPSSISLIGFSWMGGGAERIVQAIRDLKPGTSFQVCYADDFFIAVKTTEGKVYLSFPDLRQMDLHIRKLQTDKFAMWVRFCLTEVEEHFPNAYDKVLCVWQEIAVRAEIVFAKGVTARPKSGRLLSGVTGTSRVDEFVSANIIVECRRQKIFDDIKHEEDVSEALQKFAIIALEQGQEVKPETLELQEFVEGKSITGPILGQSLVFDKQLGIYVPVPQSWRCLAAIVYPKTTIKTDLNRVAHSMIQSLGVVVSGGVFHEHVYAICKEIWSVGKEKGAIPNVEMLSAHEEAGFEGVDYAAMVFDKDGKVKDFPDATTIKDMFKMDYQSKAADKQGLTDDLIERLLEDLSHLDPSKWGDAEESDIKQSLVQTKGRPVPPETPAPKAADVRTGYRISLAPATHVPGQKPEDKEARRRKNVKFEAAKAATAAKKTQAAVLSKEGFTKKEARTKRWQGVKPDDLPKETGPKVHQKTEVESQEEQEHRAQQETGISKTREKLLTSRRNALENKLLDPSLDSQTVNKMLNEIEEIDKTLGRA